MKIKVLFILPSLRSGGAERVMSFLAQNINPDKFDTHLLITGSNEDQKYQVEDIPVTFLNKSRVKHAVPAIIKFLLKKKPKIVISAIAHLNVTMGLIGRIFPNIIFVARETSISGFNLKNEDTRNKKPPILYRLALRAVDNIICQSNDMKNSLIKTHNLPVSKMVVINNPVTSKFKLKERPFAKDKVLHFITIGRLTEKKGFQRVLKVLAEFDKPFHYTIIGSGDYKDTLVNLIDELGIPEKITFVSHTDKINDYLAQNDLYLQGSYVEGFPNALLESCATGTPAVVYDAPGGINEIIIPGLNGYIAQDPSEFLEKLELSVCQDWDPAAIRESVNSRYSEKKIILEYENLFLKLLKISIE
ncbi:glycosyltransferase [Flagellimonas zhangzhouensis]|uniref:Glycosyltransferase involved in cell wall bisynthesis n=1 Tax=Flagellimonas zhangzhouensis TaxID=1073328 RepID=A0A1H2YQS1_9FLAO|nr:glycosyltransferase [Allomuricauda zhangzhouensis]SDR00301.1 Glycosyltransferase involved in cell wall bisynthesis [Allomuricauda zhangzhouensis]SDX07517.1 Glycosyltransferase involved in cell wall bisynthesis [Allomuricauda zhangzhouensis]